MGCALFVPKSSPKLHRSFTVFHPFSSRPRSILGVPRAIQCPVAGGGGGGEEEGSRCLGWQGWVGGDPLLRRCAVSVGVFVGLVSRLAASVLFDGPVAVIGFSPACPGGAFGAAAWVAACARSLGFRVAACAPGAVGCPGVVLVVGASPLAVASVAVPRFRLGVIS